LLAPDILNNKLFDSITMTGISMNISKKIILSGLAVSTFIISGCGAPIGSNKKLETADFWQRSSASSALYLQGPKAQQMLHQDISRCSSDIKELERLGEIRRAIPAHYKSGNTLDDRTAAQAEMDQWETPMRDGYLRNEHLEYADFETCMISKGWERAEYLPHGEAKNARKDYKNNYLNKNKSRSLDNREYVKSVPEPEPSPAAYINTND